MLGSAKTNLPLLTLTSWVKGTSSFIPLVLDHKLLLLPGFAFLFHCLSKMPLLRLSVFHPALRCWSWWRTKQSRLTFQAEFFVCLCLESFHLEKTMLHNTDSDVHPNYLRFDLDSISLSPFTIWFKFFCTVYLVYVVFTAIHTLEKVSRFW